MSSQMNKSSIFTSITVLRVFLKKIRMLLLMRSKGCGREAEMVSTKKDEKGQNSMAAKNVMIILITSSSVLVSSS